MSLKELQKNWDEFGKIDSLWAILTFPDKKGNKWKKEEFFKTGIYNVKGIMKYIDSLDISIQHKKALDFGCGVGRLTQALANYFDEVYGVDIAPSMIRLARKYNIHGNKCKYYLNDADNLNVFSDNSFDFIYSLLTLQHMEPQYTKKYIKEFLRILTPYGLLIFQLPHRRILSPKPTLNLKRLITAVTPKIFLDLYLKLRLYLELRAKILKQPKMELYMIKQKKFVRFLEKNGAKIIDTKQDYRVPGSISLQYCVAKKEIKK